MSDEYIEVSAKTIEEAITEACQKLSVTSDMLDVDVVDQGSSGFLGFNARPAVIRCRAKKETTKADHVQGDVLSEVHMNSLDDGQTQDKEQAVTNESIVDDQENEESQSFSDNRYPSHKNTKHSYRSSYEEYGQSRLSGKNYVAHSRSTDDFLSTTSDSSRSASRDSRNRRRSRSDRYEDNRNHSHDYHRNHSQDHYQGYDDSMTYDNMEAAAEAAARAQEEKERRHDSEPKINYTDEQISMFQERAETFLQSMFQAMNMEVTITCSFDRNENILTVDFEGDDMGVLIGKRGQTLDSIQYLVSLVVNKGVPGYVHVKADTENYRERRKKTLENLAKNMAVKVKRTRKAQALEPMNPYERRIIHSALQGDKYVTTYSEGEDPYRRVVIIPKK